MIEITKDRGTPEWRAAHRCHITASDATAIMAASGTKRRNALIERLVLDFEQVGDHRDEDPDPWMVQHEQDIVTGVAAYRRASQSACWLTGMAGSSVFSWLVASPHALTIDGAVLIRSRQSMKAYREKLGKLSKADRARAQLVAWVCDRAWCDVVDYLDQRGLADDQMLVTRVWVDEEWLLGTVVPKLISVWQAVQLQLAARKRTPATTAHECVVGTQVRKPAV